MSYGDLQVLLSAHTLVLLNSEIERAVVAARTAPAG
jgi:hypothetical protein